MNNKNSGLLVDGMTAQQLIGNELFEFQEATGFDTAAEYRASLSAAPAHPAGDAIRDAALEEAANAVPGNWLDPLLTGPQKVIDKSPAPEIEALLRGVKAAIRALRGRVG